MSLQVHKTVFINYRRDVSSMAARLLFHVLRERGYDVFIDVESINAGQFDNIIMNQIRARAHFLTLVAPGTLDRCVEEGDWVRREIEEAMRTGRNIVLVTSEGFSFKGKEESLAGDLLPDLPRYNGVTLSHEYFDAAIDKLCRRFLEPALEVEIISTPLSENSAVQRKIADVADETPPSLEELSAEEYFQRAYSKDESGDLAGAIADYGNFLRLKPDFAEAYYNRGNALLNHGDLNAAIEDYTAAIRLKPELAEAFGNRGEAHFGLGNYRAALTDFQQCNSLKAGYIFALAGLAITYHALGQTQEARRIWKEVLLPMNPNFADADWVGKELNWRPELVEAARQLIAGL